MDRFLSTLLLFICTLSVYSQSYSFRIYNEQDGLENRYINTIDQSNEGKLILGTGEGLFAFDGFEFKSYHTADSLAEEFIESSFKDDDGTIWLGHGNGSTTTFKNGKCHPIDLTNYLKSKVVDIQKDANHAIWLASQNTGIVRIIDGSNKVHFRQGLEDYTVYCFFIDPSGIFWFGTDLGVLRGQINGSNGFQTELVGDLPFSAIVDILPYKNGFVVATEDAGLFVCKIEGTNFSSQEIKYKGNPIDQYLIKSIRLDQGNNLWVSTNQSSLIAFSNASEPFEYNAEQVFNEAGSQSSKNVKVSFHDMEGNLWIGTIGSGLHKLEESYFANYFGENENYGAFDFMQTGDSLWTSSYGTIEISRIHPGNIITVLDQRNGLPLDPITSIYRDNKNNIWIGTSTKGCYMLPDGKDKFNRISLTKEFEKCSITAVQGEGDFIYVATNYGVFYIQNGKVVHHATIETGLSGNVIRSLFKDSKNRIWLGTTTQSIPYISNGELNYYEPIFSNYQLTIKSFTEDNNGNIWAGTDGNGVICLDCKELSVFTKKDGLSSDYCYGVTYQDGELWVEHRAALSRINLETKGIDIFQPEASKTLTFQDNATLADGNNIYFGTNSGTLRYDKSKDVKNTFEPILSIEKILISDFTFDNLSLINLPYGDYKIEIFFRGISLTNPKGVRYQYILEGYDTEWSELSELNVARYNHLPPGGYTFKVKAFNSDGFGGTKELNFELKIELPFWKKWWFYLLLIVGTAILFRAILNRRERMLKENQIKLQKALDERTREVVHQKEELEQKNKDITDSIVYAKNIQNAMLPPMHKLNQYFEHSFIYFKPRDIVSGDFYWVERFGTKVVIACADCTGHGVPGAFMSIIGSSILKEIINTKEINSPAMVLEKLNEELNELLNKNQTEDSIRDGMDISVVEFDTETRELRFSSANRPMFISTSGKLIEIRGDRKSIGESANGLFKFSEQAFFLNRGDRFFLFSDGMTDQFGGPNQKKIKRSGLFNHINSTLHLSLNNQYTELNLFIQTWMGEKDQLDDMILIGCEI
ncbi:MAG: two-component regulator propeller domain-containing protein [Flavobacteriales bacterium]